MIGEVNYRGELSVFLSLRDQIGELHEVPALIDTGFTSSLTLPQILIDALSLSSSGEQVVVLGDGTRERLQQYEVTVHWLGSDLVVDALAAEGLPLIGLRLLRGCFLTHHAVDGGTVMLYKP